MVADRGMEASILPWLLGLIGLSMGVTLMGVWWDEMGVGALDDVYEIRLNAYRALRQWTLVDNNYNQLYELLGYSGHDVYTSFNADTSLLTDRDINILKMLAGPHGYAVYKALLARMKDA